MPSGADWESARRLIPAGEYSSDEWQKHYAENPDTLVRMLGDIFRVYKSEERRRAGLGNPNGGRRRSRIDGSLDEIVGILTPKFSMDPFPKAYAEAAGNRSVRQVAPKAAMSHAQLHRLITGQRRASRSDLEAIARALDLHPAYFREWRSVVIQDLVDVVLETNPNISVGMVKELAR